MTREEFLDTLRMQLQGELSQAQIEGHLHYYREYISDAIAGGRSEQEVLEELGSPVFIAHTLVDSADATQESRSGWEGYWSDKEAGGYEDEQRKETYGTQVHVHKVHPLVLKIGIPVALFCVLFLVLSIVGSVLSLAVRFFVPILIIVAVLMLFKRE